MRRRNEKLILYKEYSPKENPHYVNYDAIEVSRTKNIPEDWNGAMGVPISFLDKYNPEQFEIIKFRKGDDNKDLRLNPGDFERLKQIRAVAKKIQVPLFSNHRPQQTALNDGNENQAEEKSVSAI